MHDSTFFWFGLVLTLGVSCLALSLVSKPKLSTSVNDIHAAKLADLQQQCLRLREQLQFQKTQLTEDFQTETFEQLQTLFTSYPIARKMAEAKPDLPAKNLLALLTPLENLLESWGIEPIGTPWSQVPYDSHAHQPDDSDIAEGEPVYIRFVGYRQSARAGSATQRILCPAKVSRTLPIAAK